MDLAFGCPHVPGRVGTPNKSLPRIDRVPATGGYRWAFFV